MDIENLIYFEVFNEHNVNIFISFQICMNKHQIIHRKEDISTIYLLEAQT